MIYILKQQIYLYIPIYLNDRKVEVAVDFVPSQDPPCPQSRGQEEPARAQVHHADMTSCSKGKPKVVNTN